MKNINLENKNIPTEIENILNEAYNSFIDRYGDKHADRIEKLLSEVSKSVKEIKSYDGISAMARKDRGIIYGKNKNLSAILKHELCHIYNDAYFDSKDETCFNYFPERYKEVLEKQGNIIREEYEKEQNKYKENLKNNPEVFEQYYKKTYEEFRDKFSITGDPEYEKWTEWFNTKINSKDMKNKFIDYEDGFYSKMLSSGSFYDYYTGISEIISNIVPEKELLEMFINSEDYKTDMSYKDFIDNFDKTYLDVLTENEKEKYGYPYLKIIIDTNTIDKNAGKDNKKAREAYQSATTTCFKAYMQKINSLENCDEEQFKKFYDQIKDLQEAMIWNVDINKMKDLEYVQVLEQIQDRFKEIGIKLYNKSNDKNILEKIEGIDYKTNNPFKMIEDGEKIVKEVFENKNIEKNQLLSIDNYETKVSNSGIKGNLYESLKTLLGDEGFNLLFEKYQNENISPLTDSKNGNKLSKIFKEINQLDINSKEGIFSIYNEIYDLYNKKIDENIRIDENPSANLKRYAKEIEQLKENALFNKTESKFMPSLENVINSYNIKISDFKKYIEEVTNEKIDERFNEPNNDRSKKEISKWQWQLSKPELNKLDEYTKIVNKREKENVVSDKKEILPTEVGKATMNTGTDKKDIAKQIMKKDLEKLQELNNEKNK